MMRLNMEMTGEYTRVADQVTFAALNLFVLCLLSHGLDEDRALSSAPAYAIRSR